MVVHDGAGYGDMAGTVLSEMGLENLSERKPTLVLPGTRA